MPQWDFLNFLSGQGSKFPEFELRMQNEAVGLIRLRQQGAGVRVHTPEGPAEIQADLVIGCDGRHSMIRQAAQLEVIELGVPIDVLWFRISRHTNDPEQLLGNINYGRALVLIDRGDYFQAGLIIRKGSFEEIKADGLRVVSRYRGLNCSLPRRSAGRATRLGADQASVRADQPPASVVSARTAVHRSMRRTPCLRPAASELTLRFRMQWRLLTCSLIHFVRVALLNQPLPLCSGGENSQLIVTQQMQVFAHGLFQRVFQNTGPQKHPGN